MLADITQFSQVIANAGKTVRVGNSDPFRGIASIIPEPPEPFDCHIREIGVANAPGPDEYARQSRTQPKDGEPRFDVSVGENPPARQPERPDFAKIMAQQETDRLTAVEGKVVHIEGRLQTIEQDVKTILGRLP